MKPRHLIAIVLLLLLLVGGALFLLSLDPAVAPDRPDDTSVAPTDEGVDPDAAKKPAVPKQPSRKWVARGQGSVTGRLLEYATDKPVTGALVTLMAGLPGPNLRLEVTTGLQGEFRFEGVTNFEAWTLIAAPPEPLSELRLAGVGVVEERETALGILYVTPSYPVPGRVIDERGNPIENALVRATLGAPSGQKMDILKLIRDFPAPPASVDETRTDGQGDFELTKVPPGSYDFEVSAAGFQLVIRRGVIVTPEAKDRPLEFVLPGGFVLKGRVVREDGGPKEGITVVAFPEPANELAMLRIDRRFATTDKDGNFRVEGLGAGTYWASCTPDKRPYVVVQDLQIPGTDHVDLVVKGGATLKGRITGAADEAVVDASVYVLVMDPPMLVGSAQTDGDGRYELYGLRPGPVDLFMITAEGYGTFPSNFLDLMRGRPVGGLSLADGENVKDVQLGAGGTLRGVVTSSVDDTPLPGVTLMLASVASFVGGSKTAISDAEGKFELTGLPVGSSMLIASKDGYFQPGASVMSVGLMLQNSSGTGARDTGRGSVIVIGEPGAVVEREVQLALGSMIEGRVLTPQGEPLPGAQVSVMIDPGMERLRPVAALFPIADSRLTDAEGRYTLPAPGPGNKAIVTAVAQGYLSTTLENISAVPGKTYEGADITMRAGATIEGRVTSTEGKPLAGAVVRWVREGDGNNDWSVRWALRSAPSAPTDEAGAFKLRNVETGKLIVQVDHTEYLSRSQRGVEAAEGKAVRLDMELTQGGSLSGQVLGTDGQPFGGAQIDLTFGGEEPADADPFASGPPDETSRADGTFKVTGLLPGSYGVQARAPGYAPSERAAVQSTGGKVTLRLAPALMITGVVRATDGGLVANVEIDAYRMEGEERKYIGDTRTSPEGQFELRDLPAGNYTLEINQGWRWGGGGTANVLPKTVTGVAAGMTNMVIEVDPGLAIRGEVRIAGGELLAAGWVSVSRIQQEGEDPSAANNTNTQVLQGEFEATGLTPGTYNVTVNGEGYAAQTVQVAAGRDDLRVQLTRGGKISGTVFGPDGAPFKGANVWAVGAAGAWTQSKADGTFEIASAAPGTYRVTAGAQADGLQLAGFVEEVVVTEGGEVSGLSITLLKQQ